MICPNCDGMLNVIGCQACGWKMGDPWPEYRLLQGSPFPLKAAVKYPARTGNVVVVTVVEPPKVELPVPEAVIRADFDHLAVSAEESAELKSLAEKTKQIQSKLDDKLSTETVQ